MAMAAASKAGPRLAEVAGRASRNRESLVLWILERIVIFPWQCWHLVGCRGYDLPAQWRQDAATTAALRKRGRYFSACSSVLITASSVASSTMGGRRNAFNVF